MEGLDAMTSGNDESQQNEPFGSNDGQTEEEGSQIEVNEEEAATEEAAELMELIEDTMDDWDKDPEANIYIEDGTLTADVEEIRNEMAILTVMTMSGME